MGLIKNWDLLLQMGVTGYLLAWWLHARSRIVGGLRRRCKVSDSARIATAQEALWSSLSLLGEIDAKVVKSRPVVLLACDDSGGGGL